jgi:hypothetical protein
MTILLLLDLPQLPGVVSDVARYLLGPGYWWWLVFATVPAIYYLRARVKTQVSIERSSSLPPIEEALADETMAPSEAAETQAATNTTDPPPSPSRMPVAVVQQTTDPQVAKITAAFEAAKDRMVEQFLDAINRLEVSVTLPPPRKEEEEKEEASDAQEEE